MILSSGTSSTILDASAQGVKDRLVTLTQEWKQNEKAGLSIQPALFVVPKVSYILRDLVEGDLVDREVFG